MGIDNKLFNPDVLLDCQISHTSVQEEPDYLLNLRKKMFCLFFFCYILICISSVNLCLYYNNYYKSSIFKVSVMFLTDQQQQQKKQLVFKQTV